MILMIIAAMLTSLTVAREWENGTMEQLLSTPVRPVEIALGKLSAYFVLGIVDMLMSLFVAHCDLRCSHEGELGAAVCFELCVSLWRAGVGHLYFRINRNQLTAYQLSTLTSFLPAFLLSGFIYSIQSMPVVIQFIALFVPARYFIDIVKGIFLKGIGLETSVVRFPAAHGLRRRRFYLATRKLRQKVA